MRICKNVHELVETLKRCCYERNSNKGGQVLVCNFCTRTFLSFQDVMEHIIVVHAGETIPDVDATK